MSSVQDVLSSDRRRDALNLRVRDYYASERLYLLRCLKHLLSFYSEQHHPYSVSTITPNATMYFCYCCCCYCSSLLHYRYYNTKLLLQLAALCINIVPVGRGMHYAYYVCAYIICKIF